MLKLVNITKNYVVGNNLIPALKGIDLEFRKNEFVSVIGPSGCGKTTLLNIIGGLDKYTTGDLLINGRSTKAFKDSDWDSYRNGTIGMVFQNYNLISHLSVLDNVSVALSLSGIGVLERKERAISLLKDVGLEDQIYKKPNQLSGGQMQRVAIARALINNPDILLADEPTGALDTTTSIQIMEILKRISKDRLVIMVTHNQELAGTYSDRIVNLIDGLVKNDSKEYANNTDKNNKYQKLTNKKTSMSFLTALKHSFKNLMTKKKRTIITSLAGSIGIIGVALVLSISNGMTDYISIMQSDTLAGFPLSISQTTTRFNQMQGGIGGINNNTDVFPNDEIIYTYDSAANTISHTNVITNDYIAYLDAMDKKLYNSITYSQGIEMNVVTKTDTGNYKKINTTNSGIFGGLFGGAVYFNELPTSTEFVLGQYDILGVNSHYPKNANEIALVIDSRNRVDIKILDELGINITDNYDFNDILGRKIKVMNNDDYYYFDNNFYKENTLNETLYNNTNNIELTIVCILRVKESASSEILSSGLQYTNELTKMMLLSASTSEIAVSQNGNKEINVLTGLPFNSSVTYESVMLKIGANSTPTGIQIYPVSFEAKEEIKTYMDTYNLNKQYEEHIIYTDLAEMVTSAVSTLINTITIVLTAFAAISLVVSSIMIGIITYVSVVERTKEIGILRAIGARKKDISRLFNAEVIIIGFIAGTVGIIITMLLSIPINLVISNLVGISTIATLKLWHGLILVLISMTLTLIGGLIPSKLASKKDPVVALRTE